MKLRLPPSVPALAIVSVAILGLSVGAAGDDTGWRIADPGYRITLPRDHASHPDYRVEWWYYTGNLESAAGRRFGYQLTLFRVGVERVPVNPSRWALRDLYLAHFAITDIDGGRHLFADKLNRAGVDWAGASPDTLLVWNEQWQASLAGLRHHRLTAESDRMRLALDLDEGKPAALNGSRGYSRKGELPGNASMYYSLTRMPTRGTISIDGAEIEVSGESWMDHEFSSSVLEPGQEGWDWLAMQLSDDTEVMLYRMRRADGRKDPASSGTFVDGRGVTRGLTAEDFEMSPIDWWTSPVSAARYPIAWSVRVPSLKLELTVKAAIPAQELRTERSTRVTYWEGAIVVRGRAGDAPVAGRGYLELTGYAGRPLSDVLR